MKAIWIIIIAVFLGVISISYMAYFVFFDKNRKKIFPMRVIDRIKYSVYLSFCNVILFFSLILLVGAYDTFDINKEIPLKVFSSLPICGAILFPCCFIGEYIFLYNSDKAIKFIDSRVNANPKVKVIFDEMRKKRDK